MSDDAFLSRWSRRKQQARQGAAPARESDRAEATPPLPRMVDGGAADTGPGSHSRVEPARTASGPAGEAKPLAAPPAAPPTLDDVAKLTPGSDYSRFVARDVAAGVRNAALKKLFSHPQFNVMDGLDTYIDDYGKPDPLPASMLRRMVQSQALGLFRDEKPSRTQPEESALPPRTADADNALTAPIKDPRPDEDVDLQLQPVDAPRATDDGLAAPGAGEDTGRER